MHMSSQGYINAASEYKYICILIYNTFCSATFYNDPPMITHAVDQGLGPQEVKHNAHERAFPKIRIVHFLLNNILNVFMVCA